MVESFEQRLKQLGRPVVGEDRLCLPWKPISTAPKDQFVLVASKSGYVTIKWAFLTARFSTYHGRWDDVGNDSVRDCGYVPEYWCELPDDPTPPPKG